MFNEELVKASKKLNWDLHQQILILERFATYKNVVRELNVYLIEKAEDQGISIFDEGTYDVLDIASETEWSAEILIDNIISFLEKESDLDSFKKYITICFHNK